MIGILIDIEKTWVHKDFAAGKVQPNDTDIAHLVDEPQDFFEAQFSWKEFLRVVRVCVAVNAMKVASIGELKLGLHHAVQLLSPFMELEAEILVLNLRDRTCFKHGVL